MRTEPHGVRFYGADVVEQDEEGPALPPAEESGDGGWRRLGLAFVAEEGRVTSATDQEAQSSRGGSAKLLAQE